MPNSFEDVFFCPSHVGGKTTTEQLSTFARTTTKYRDACICSYQCYWLYQTIVPISCLNPSIQSPQERAHPMQHQSLNIGISELRALQGSCGLKAKSILIDCILSKHLISIDLQQSTNEKLATHSIHTLSSSKKN